MKTNLFVGSDYDCFLCVLIAPYPEGVMLQNSKH